MYIPGNSLWLLATLNLGLWLHSAIYDRVALVNAQVTTMSESDVHFYLYNDRSNPDRSKEIVVGDSSSVSSSQFAPGRPTVILVNGFHNKQDTPKLFVDTVKRAYLSSDLRVNLIVTDWSKLSLVDQPIVTAALYYIGVEQNEAPTAGRAVCNLINFLTQFHFITGPEQIHIVGHSLGCHISGVAGQCVRERSGRSVDRITALDPAIPFLGQLSKNFRIDPTDATFVDALHTGAGLAMLGTGLRVGTVDFYANGGTGGGQPGCFNLTLNPIEIIGNGVIGLCSHSRAFQYFARSILRCQPELIACRCLTTIDLFVIPAVCFSPFTATCREPTPFGEYVPRTAKGAYYISVPNNLNCIGELPPPGSTR